MAKDHISKRTRVGNTLISVTTEIETESAIVDYADILDATTVKSDDDNGDPPWEDCDGWEHTIDELGSSIHTNSRPRNDRVCTDCIHYAEYGKLDDTTMDSLSNE